MKIRELAEILATAPDKLKEANFVGTFQHNPDEIGVLVRMPGRSVNTLWSWEKNGDPEWSEFDESVIPPE